jgi:molybdate transport system ATP-binding protein
VLEVSLRKSQGNFFVDAAFVTNGAGVTALFGRSGSGKTSVINMVAGLTRPDAGKVTVDGKTCFDSQKGIDISPDKRRFGYIFQDGRLFPHLSVKSNLTYGMNLVPSNERYVEFGQVVELLGISRLLHRRPAKLSGGEKQRVAIGRALLMSPRLLLMDEPLASLDEERKTEVLPFIAKLPKEFSIPILYVSHSVEEIRALAVMVVVMDRGRTVAVKKAEELLSVSDALAL